MRRSASGRRGRGSLGAPPPDAREKVGRFYRSDHHFGGCNCRLRAGTTTQDLTPDPCSDAPPVSRYFVPAVTSRRHPELCPRRKMACMCSNNAQRLVRMPNTAFRKPHEREILRSCRRGPYPWRWCRFLQRVPGSGRRHGTAWSSCGRSRHASQRPNTVLLRLCGAARMPRICVVLRHLLPQRRRRVYFAIGWSNDIHAVLRFSSTRGTFASRWRCRVLHIICRATGGHRTVWWQRGKRSRRARG